MIDIGKEIIDEANKIEAIFHRLYNGTDEFTYDIMREVITRLTRIRILAKKETDAKS